MHINSEARIIYMALKYNVNEKYDSRYLYMMIFRGGFGECYVTIPTI